MTTGHIPDTELAWAAGFFDGEGCFSLNAHASHRKTYAVAQMNQNDPRPLERFRLAVGVGSVTGPYKRRTKGWSPYWAWSTAKREGVAEVLRLLWPWLGPVKRGAGARALLDATGGRRENYRDGAGIVTTGHVSDNRYEED